MQRLTRKWWKRGRRVEGGGDDGDRFSLPTRDEFQPIDSQEQEQMVRTFEKAHAQQSRLWRAVFGGFLLGYGAFLVYSILQQAWYPWELRFHAYFMHEIPVWMVVVADCMAVLSCLLAVKGLFQSSRSYQQWMWYSCYTGIMLAGFWLYYMMRLSRFHWDVIWLPLGPLSGAGICLYVDHLLDESLQDIQKLRNCMYNYKAM